MTTTKLQTFEAFGMVNVEAHTITVILAATSADGTTHHRTLKAETPRTLPIGAALIGVSVETGDVHAYELGEGIIVAHPDVMKMIEQATEWIKASAGA